jgi:3'-5' exonuclease
VLEISEAGSAWTSTAAPGRGLGRPVAGRGRALIRGLQGLTPSLIWIKAVGIEDGNCEKVTTRMKPTVIVWDLETVPDLSGFAAAHDLAGKSAVEVREAIGDKFPKHIYHSIVCIGALIAHWESDHWAVDAVGAPHVGERTEKELISAFCDKVAELSPRLVTFNGHSFDLPVLRYRAMVHGVSAPGLSVRPYFHRYTEDAVDLCDVFSSFSPQGKATLHEIGRIMGLPGKPKGFDGGEVERYFREGKIREIADYCETDVVGTYQVWLRYELFRGTLSENAFEASRRNLADFMKEAFVR